MADGVCDALRFKVCNEILETERAYCRYLEQMSKFYLQPLANEKLIEKGPVEKLFREVAEIQNINKIILNQLEERMARWTTLPPNKQQIGDIFSKLSPFLKLYSEYVSDYHTNLEYLNRQLEKKSVAKFLEKCSAQVPPEYDQKQSLSSLLIMPIQRIPRYQLLLTELLKNTDSSHPDYSEIAKALELVKEVAKRVDSMVKERQNLERLIQISKSVARGAGKENIPATLVSLGRTFIFEGSLVKACRKDNQERYFFLFSDALLYCKILNTLSETKYEGRGLLYLTGATVTDLPDKGGMCNRFAIQTMKKSFIVSAHTPEEKKQWIELLQKVISDLAATTADLKNRAKKEGNRTDIQLGDDDSSEEELKAAAVWIQDSDAPDCMICGKHFNTFFRRHHCRNCGDVVCDNCSRKRMILKHISTEKKLRVCSTCFEKLSKEDTNKQKPRTSENTTSTRKIQTVPPVRVSPSQEPSRPSSFPSVQKNRITTGPLSGGSLLSAGDSYQTTQYQTPAPSSSPQSQSIVPVQSTPPSSDRKRLSPSLRPAENKLPRGRSTPSPLSRDMFVSQSQPKSERTLPTPPTTRSATLSPAATSPSIQIKSPTNANIPSKSPNSSPITSSPKKENTKPSLSVAKAHQKAASLNSAPLKTSPSTTPKLSPYDTKNAPHPVPSRSADSKSSPQTNMNGVHVNNNPQRNASKALPINPKSPPLPKRTLPPLPSSQQ
jgi:hypothetical protein